MTSYSCLSLTFSEIPDAWDVHFIIVLLNSFFYPNQKEAYLTFTVYVAIPMTN